MSDLVQLAVTSLTKSYGRKLVVRGVSFQMHEGEIVGFLGPNGAGKTTCFYMIVGFIRPNSGRILLGGRDITRKPMYKRARQGISYLPQEASVFRKLTVEQNVWAVLETRKDLTRRQKREMLEQLLEELGIQHKRKQRAYTLSGGERRRTEIARSLAIQPRFLLLDEPFAGIDPIAVYEIKQIVGELSARASVCSSPTTTSVTRSRSRIGPTSSRTVRSSSPVLARRSWRTRWRARSTSARVSRSDAAGRPLRWTRRYATPRNRHSRAPADRCRHGTS